MEAISLAVILADATQARSKFRNALKDVEARNADWLIVLDVSKSGLQIEDDGSTQRSEKDRRADAEAG
jgi:hypothetical protein